MQTTLILSVLAPAGIALVMLLLGHRVWRGSDFTGGRWSVAIAPPLGAIAAYTVVREFPGLPPSDAAVWPLWIALAVALIVTVEDGLNRSWPVRTVIALLASALTAWLVSRPLMDTWSTGQAAAWIGASAAALTLTWTALDVRAERVSGPGVPVAMAGLSGGAAALLGTSGTALLAQTAAGAGAAWGTVVLLGLWRTDLVTRTAVGATVVMLGGLVLSGIHYAEVQLASAGLLVLAGVVLGLLPLPGFTSGRIGSPLPGGIVSAIVMGFVTLLGVGAAVGSTFIMGPETADTASEQAPDSGDGEDDDYGYD